MVKISAKYSAELMLEQAHCPSQPFLDNKLGNCELNLMYVHVINSYSLPFQYVYRLSYIGYNPVSQKYVTLSRLLIYSFVIWDKKVPLFSCHHYDFQTLPDRTLVFSESKVKVETGG